MKLRAVLFDLDGTLTKFLLDYKKVRFKAIEILSEYDLKGVQLDPNISVYLTLKKVKDIIDPSTFASIKKRIYQIYEEVEIEAAERVTRDTSVEILIKTLREMNLKIGLVTNNGRIGTMKSLEKLGLRDAFDVIVTRDDSDELKPDKGGMVKALRSLNVEPNEALFVGDSVADIIAAKSAGLVSVAVPTGPFSVEELLKAAPDYFIDSVHSLPELIRYLNESCEGSLEALNES
ncbi:MAG: HAD family hydrolase [Nitrososphaerota archaeon]|nr:HAD family hydrolase [Nitrososphaerales archaeon]MCX8191787.1 HAD family hydrolase [Nitrososphaerales archaeon]MDW8044839.1 HAD family hydrolase [Nitrososphaerota archaeon]